mmetsp:Transcript_2654/g.7892  ORF Transcript_2654/g.7892 Transcript_2654/m.7892 type:complete len:166 (-) Transcript_2654:1455-1952(-)
MRLARALSRTLSGTRATYIRAATPALPGWGGTGQCHGLSSGGPTDAGWWKENESAVNNAWKLVRAMHEQDEIELRQRAAVLKYLVEASADELQRLQASPDKLAEHEAAINQRYMAAIREPRRMSLIETLKKFDIKVQGGPDENIRFIDALLEWKATPELEDVLKS